MAKRPTLTDLTSLTNSSAINTLNQNWDSIQEAFDNTLSRDGSTPNAMNADLDLNGNALLNVGTIDVSNLTLDGQTVTDIASVPEWKGAWVTATSYIKNDLVKTAGNVYICLISHTSSAAFSTDLTALRWELMVTKGDSGAGTGDLVSTNNLSDLSNAATARSNLGLGTVAIENTVPVAKGGTGAVDATNARSNLGLGSLATLSSITTTQIAAATLVTASETIAANNNDTTIPTSAAVKAYADGLAGSGEGGPTTASGTSVSFSSIPSTARKITIFLNGLSVSGTDDVLVQIGTGGTAETTGYEGQGGRFNNAAAISTGPITNGFFLGIQNAANGLVGRVTLEKEPGSNAWHASSTVANQASGFTLNAGRKSLSGVLDMFRVIPNGANTFDAGTVSYRWES